MTPMENKRKNLATKKIESINLYDVILYSFVWHYKESVRYGAMCLKHKVLQPLWWIICQELGKLKVTLSQEYSCISIYV